MVKAIQVGMDQAEITILIVKLNFARIKGFSYHLKPNINANHSLIAVMETVFAMRTDLAAISPRIVILKFAGTMGYLRGAKITMIANMAHLQSIVVELIKLPDTEDVISAQSLGFLSKVNKASCRSFDCVMGFGISMLNTWYLILN